MRCDAAGVESWAQMKAWSGVLLCLLSVCRAAPLTCDQLLAPTDNNRAPQLSGRWHLQAISTDSCVFSTIMRAFQGSSIASQFASTSIPNLYDVSVTLKILGLCLKKSMAVFAGNNTLFEVDKENNPTGSSLILVPSSSDYIVLTTAPEKPFKGLFLYSRMETLGIDKLEEIKILAECLNLPTPWQYSTDYDVTNCRDISKCDPNDAQVTMIKQQMRKVQRDLLSCATSSFLVK